MAAGELGGNEIHAAIQGLACSCATPEPERVMARGMSLLACRACGYFVLGERKRDDLADLREEVAGLRLIADALQEQALAQARRPPVEAGAPQPSALGSLRLLPGGLEPRSLDPDRGRPRRGTTP